MGRARLQQGFARRGVIDTQRGRSLDPSSPQRIRPLSIAAIALLLLAASTALAPTPASAAPKTDIVILRNGDHITGEVKDLENGRLKFSTDDMGTLYIEWEDIASLTATRVFEFQTVSGEILHGSIRNGPEPGTILVADGTVLRTVRFDELASVVELGRGFWGATDGSLNLGFSYVQATEILQFSLSFDAIHHSTNKEDELRLSSNLTRQPDEQDDDNADSDEGAFEVTARNSFDFIHRRFLGRRQFLWGKGQLSSNDEIGLDLRALIAAGWGMRFIQTYRQRMYGFGGLAVSRENPTGDDSSHTITEVYLGLGYGASTYDFPKTTAYVSLSAYPGINPSGSIRGMLDASFSREVLHDFTLGLTVFDDYDSDPPDPEAHTNDFGITFTIGWTF